MDARLEKALDFSNYRQTFSIQRKTLREKAEAKLTYGFSGGLFKIDQTLISFVQTLCDKGRTENVVLLDANNNPVLVEDLENFQEEILDRYFTVTNEYYTNFKELKSSRSVEKLISYE